MSDLAAVYAAFQTALGDGTASWGVQAWAEFVPKSVSGTPISRPYVIYSYQGGGDRNRILKSDPNLIIAVKCVADTLDAALAGVEEIKVRLDDHGEMDAIRTVLGDNKYGIKTISHELRIHFVESVQGATQIYHSGGQYRVQMERR